VRTDEDFIVNNGVTAGQVVPLDVVTYDRGGLRNSTTPSRLTVPAGWPGVYSLGASVRFLAGTDDTGHGYRALFLRLNGTIILASQKLPDVRLGTEPTDLTVTTDYELVATDYVEMVVQQARVTPENITADQVTPFSASLWLTCLHR